MSNKDKIEKELPVGSIVRLEGTLNYGAWAPLTVCDEDTGEVVQWDVWWEGRYQFKRIWIKWDKFDYSEIEDIPTYQHHRYGKQPTAAPEHPLAHGIIISSLGGIINNSFDNDIFRLKRAYDLERKREVDIIKKEINNIFNDMDIL